jgi:hypothetical protein
MDTILEQSMRELFGHRKVDMSSLYPGTKERCWSLQDPGGLLYQCRQDL